MSKLDNLLNQEKLHRFEGESGVRNLAILCRNLGYYDKNYFGQFSHKASYGDLILFLEDNPGAVECLLDFIRENEDSFFNESFEDQNTEEE